MNAFASPIKTAPGSLTMRGVTFRAAVAWANDVKEFQVTGAAWIDDMPAGRRRLPSAASSSLTG